MSSTCVPFLPGKSQRLSTLERVHQSHTSPVSKENINFEGSVSLYAATGNDPRPSPGSPLTREGSDVPGDGSEADSAGDALERLRQICQSAMSGPSSLDGDGESPAATFPCHLCPFVCCSREAFNDHLNNHYDFRCSLCSFATTSEAAYRDHLHKGHGLQPEELEVEEERGLRAPQVNAQGKVKTLKCKQCDYVTVTKEEFWRHCKGHIKPEKRLGCPKCLFVTEYKHHLEYHLRNHFGSKPFKCPQCHYSCVNKSMLSSHMKSHTTVYQYRCRDCTYATKYCHSLKLHLRKYGHAPAMVLNPDGTPNPLPIVDVYGTRRGPKIKRDDKGNVLGPPEAVAFQTLGHAVRAVTAGSGEGLPRECPDRPDEASETSDPEPEDNPCQV